MRVSFVHNGTPFIPTTTAGDMEDLLLNPPKTAAEDLRDQIDIVTRVLQRTDPSVTRDMVRALPYPELTYAYRAVMNEPANPLGPEVEQRIIGAKTPAPSAATAQPSPPPG